MSTGSILDPMGMWEHGSLLFSSHEYCHVTIHVKNRNGGSSLGCIILIMCSFYCGELFRKNSDLVVEYILYYLWKFECWYNLKSLVGQKTSSSNVINTQFGGYLATEWGMALSYICWITRHFQVNSPYYQNGPNSWFIITAFLKDQYMWI